MIGERHCLRKRRFKNDFASFQTFPWLCQVIFTLELKRGHRPSSDRDGRISNALPLLFSKFWPVNIVVVQGWKRNLPKSMQSSCFAHLTYCFVFLLLFFFLRSHCHGHHSFVISKEFWIKWFKIIRKGPTAVLSWAALYCLPQGQCSLVFHKMCLYSLRVSSLLYTFQNLPTWYVHLCLKVHYLILNPCWIN